jgi:tRNA threonylcarbamoyladenosine biosynthesis protein TsaB
VKILAFDTATRATAVALALAADEPPLEARDDPPADERPRHTTRLLPLIAELLEQGGTSFDALDRIAVGIGPGTFTGLRIGIATARALAQARATPLVAISTLHSLALGAERARVDGLQIDAVLPLIDARRGEVFAAVWHADQLERPPCVAARALTAHALVELVQDLEDVEPAKTLAVGDGALAFRAVVERAGVLVPADGSGLHRVTAANHCRLARSLAPRHPDQIRPCYLRSPDAKPARQTIPPR